MNWLLETLTEPSMIQAVAVISIVAAVGVYLGRLKIFGISLGITFVFFAGIMAGHLGITVNKDMLNFAQNFGLIVFVYTLGLQVGPGFFSSLKKGGVEMNTMGLGVIALGLILTLVFHWITGISVPVMVGLLSGAVTNTPALGAAQQALLQMDPENTRNVTDMALACAVAYPLGVVGVILAIIILRSLFAKKTQSTHKEQDTTTNVAEFQVLNPSIYNKSIQQVMKLTEKHFVISRRIVVTRNRVNGVKLGSLRLRNLYGINITRVNRAGIDLVASRDLRLQIGDKLTIVGEANSVNNVGKILGDELKRLDNPNLLAIFVGLTLGVLIGAIPIAIPGMSTPIKLGIAGGPIIVGILMGAFGPRFHLTTYTTQSANLMMRQFGIVIYLAGLGIDSGAHFFETVFRAEGLLWIGLGFLLTIVPVLIVGFIASQFFKLDYAHNIGMLCGSMANPMALSYANTTVEGDEPSVSYATVYPLSMFIRVISAQLLIMLFT